jgi:predicted short-subunit dehydrogenase-like oxidoreductase (DUF2520 family)
MQIVLIGAGNVATILGRLLQEKGHRVIQVINRRVETARTLGALLNAPYADFSGTPDSSADAYIVAVSDIALQEHLPPFDFQQKPVFHTAGSVSKDILKHYSANYGVLYPLQSLRKEMEQIPPIPFLVDGCNEWVQQVLLDLAGTLSNQVQIASDEYRMKIHTAAVVVSNFTNHLYALAADFCNHESVDFQLLLPLIQETAQRIQYLPPASVQTGPAIRKDIGTLDKHLRLLHNYPQLRTAYLRLTDSIMNP